MAVLRECLSWIYPSQCPLCKTLSDAVPCEFCRSEMELAEPHYVLEPNDSPLAYRTCFYAYKGRAAQAVRRLKYSRCTSLTEFMASCVAARLTQCASPNSLIVPVPLHRMRNALRGFNQAAILCSRAESWPVEPGLLRRVRFTRPQAGLSRPQREQNIHGAFAATRALEGADCILVDDVVTSGNTARECARVLKDAGANSVGIVAFAGNLD